MSDRIVIERLEFQGQCGVTEEERRLPQPLAVDLTLEYPSGALEIAAAGDDIRRAVDYAAVAARIVELGSAESFALLETLAERLSAMLFSEFRVSGLQLWVRKTVPPVKDVRGSVGVRLERTKPMAARGAPHDPPPAQFLQDQTALLPKGTILDLAAGRGRHALYLASLGYAVEALDRDQEALDAMAAEAKRRNLPDLIVRQIDLERDAAQPPDLGKERYDGIIVFYYLHRPLFPALLRALKPGGLLLYETFLIDNHLRRHHPRRKEFCLGHNELLHLVPGLRILHYDEGDRNTGHGDEPAFTARLAARREG
jgi:dihydroneopterin aldolase